MEDPKNLKVKNWKEVAKYRTWRDLAEKAKPHEGSFYLFVACSIT